MKITKLTERDKASILSLFKKVTSVLRRDGVDQWDRFYPNRFIIGKDLKQQNLYGVKVEDRVIAVVTVDQNLSKNYETIVWQGDKKYASCIHRLAIHPEYQGQGLGKKLLQFAEDQARTAGNLSIRLDVYSTNPSAIAMYHNAGYQKRGQISFPFRRKPYLCFEKSLF